MSGLLSSSSTERKRQEGINVGAPSDVGRKEKSRESVCDQVRSLAGGLCLRGWKAVRARLV